MIREGEEIIAAILGGSKCGKTTLAQALARSMRARHGLPSIVFDPIPKSRPLWGPWCWVTGDLERFRRAVWGSSGKAVFWDESSDTLDKHAREDRAFFTRIRHQHRAFFLIAHDHSAMSPIMRGNLSDLYAFKLGPKRAAILAEDLAAPELIDLPTLGRREFMHWRPFEGVTRRLPTLEELARL